MKNIENKRNVWRLYIEKRIFCDEQYSVKIKNFEVTDSVINKNFGYPDLSIFFDNQDNAMIYKEYIENNYYCKINNIVR